MYFANIPNIYYDFDINGNRSLKIVKDITVNFRVIRQILENVSLFDEYDMKEGETPDIVANKVYGSSEYHWVIMILNERYDHIEDYPRSYHAFEEYVNAKYENPQTTHHYENEDGFIVNSDEVGAIPISNYEYENRLNESKRRIKLISSQALQQILAQFKSLT